MSERKPTPIKKCAACRKVLERKRYGKRIEGLAVFLKRKYCGLLCFAKDHSK